MDCGTDIRGINCLLYTSYKRLVLEETPPEDIELADILKKAKELHEYLRNYGGLGEDEKDVYKRQVLRSLLAV